ncbi:MAG: sugar phosphate isomerase/epimerase [Planctomycetaceae bacterium]
MKLGYNTNGLPHHSWSDALELIAETGYRSVAITVDHHCLNPFAVDFQSELQQMKKSLDRLNLSCVIETGARFLLNPRRKHEPTLLSVTAEERKKRVEFLNRCIEIAAFLNADAVSFWSGILRDSISRSEAMSRLAEECSKVVRRAVSEGVQLAFEPEPGMFIESFDDFAELMSLMDSPDFGLTVDIGHVHCVEEGSIAAYLHEWRNRIFNIHIEDMVRGVHEHLRFGAGTIDFPPVLAALKEIDYKGGLHVELSRHGHMAPDVLQESYRFLNHLLDDTV